MTGDCSCFPLDAWHVSGVDFAGAGNELWVFAIPSFTRGVTHGRCRIWKVFGVCDLPVVSSSAWTWLCRCTALLVQKCFRDQGWEQALLRFSSKWRLGYTNWLLADLRTLVFLVNLDESMRDMTRTIGLEKGSRMRALQLTRMAG